MLNDNRGNAVQRNGSFINDDYLYTAASKEAKVRSSSCYSLKKNEKVSIRSCEKDFQAGLHEMEISDLLIQQNGIKQLKAAYEQIPKAAVKEGAR